MLCSLLTGCFFLPGNFVSQLDVRRDGTFDFTYVGEIVTTLPEEGGARKWDPAMAHCYREDSDDERTCATDEIARQRTRFDASENAREQQAADIAELVGYDAYDEAANEEFARKMENFKGWDKVAYKGHGVFAVEYRLSGTLEREMTFPVLPQAQMVMPFLTIRRAKDMVVEVEAPGLTPHRLREVMLRALQGANGTSDRNDVPMFNRARGRFTLTSDTDLTASNGEESVSGDRHTVVWTIDGDTEIVPQAQIVLDR
ncbi:hypothetical protein ACFFF7_11980 [Novosphingobium aquiterrae]|uniref:Lipoprotein n=1 Tax=Novosphingobium aquiterrae TaxID=624388 RepID=A0ABV6PJY6_9SPHN